jgi:hypothetical protein
MKSQDLVKGQGSYPIYYLQFENGTPIAIDHDVLVPINTELTQSGPLPPRAQ